MNNTINNTMITSSQFKDLKEFLVKHSAKTNLGSPFTHTRIGNKELNLSFKIISFILDLL